MNAFKKTIVAASIAAASLFSINANAALFNEFSVSVEGKNFKADKIGGNYVELATFNPDGTFNVSLLWNAGQFITGGGTQNVRNTGLDNDYGIYAIYKASGNYTTTGGATTFNFLPGSGALQMFLDVNNDTDRTVPTTGSGNFVFTSSGDDRLLATGNALSGEGTLNPSLSTCGDSNGLNCGSFGSETTFSLTPFGKTIFVAPNPFYNMSFQSGNLNNFTPTGTVEINGGLNVVFSRAAEVPEPASVGLLGLGMLGLYAARRRNKKAA
ncbi:flocculation-associated PEP-CTERM protein PepA [Oxalobacteraceae sp. CFBP 13708]|nr:flocculation-associated PEP-CTERM protein PepA [Oxalobacteraceae sp. CFBP 8761]MBD8725092.1 flocculation-associated PEP-CTERM protein PepA [Oxalobacteraceae sp. CFBP 13708]